MDAKVYVGGLPEDATSQELEDAFGRYGRIRKVWVARRPPGFAFVEFDDVRDAEDAVKGLDGTRICGVRARVELSHGRSRNGGSDRGYNGGGGGGRGRRYSRWQIASPPAQRITKSTPGFYTLPRLLIVILQAMDRARVRRMLVETVRRLLVDRRAMTVRLATIAGLLVAAAPGIVGLWM
ncbi:Sr protein [Aphelenchoides avenae]|nr:Sr protein [Aphelenchus avenae]